jgi:hypothetical protein
VTSGAVSYLGLAAALVERIQPVLPEAIRLRVAGPAEVEALNDRWARAPFKQPAHRHDMGLVVLSFVRRAETRWIQVGPFGESGPGVLDIWEVRQALSDLADEASEETTDRYEADAEVEGPAMRVWFGLVPPGSPQGGPWRDVVPELAPILLADIGER